MTRPSTSEGMFQNPFPAAKLTVSWKTMTQILTHFQSISYLCNRSPSVIRDLDLSPLLISAPRAANFFEPCTLDPGGDPGDFGDAL
jgi:hypothetical protein